MKENKYDDDIFFEKYSHMSRSIQGLDGAGEWHEMQKLMPDFGGKRVLDLGCGYGWHCFYAAEHGAQYVLGTDISEKMLEIARGKNTFENIEFQKIAMEDIAYEDSSFDIVLSSLAFHYVKEYKALVKNISRMLKPGGTFLFSVEHPVFTAYGTQDWYYNEAGEILHFPVDNYYYEGEREAIFLGERVVKYHRIMTTYLNTLLEEGLQIQHIVEPMPPEDMLHIPGMKDEMRRPMMLLVSAGKPL